MNTVRLSNISLKDFRQFLFDKGCSRTANGTKGRGGHEKWEKNGMTRPITLQTHVDPVPEHIVRNSLRDLAFHGKHLSHGFLGKFGIKTYAEYLFGYMLV